MVEEKIVERVETVNKFIELDEFEDGTLKSTAKLLKNEVLTELGVCHLFPDPSGEFTIVSTGKGYQIEITVRGKDDIECMVSENGNEMYLKTLYSNPVEDVEKTIEESVKS